MRFVLAIMLASSVMTLSSTTFAQVFMGLDMPGKHALRIHGNKLDYDSELGLGFGAEVVNQIHERALLGGGFEFQLPRDIMKDGDNKGSFQFIPAYLVCKAGIGGGNQFQPYVFAHFGANFFLTDEKYFGYEKPMGLYWAMGAELVTAANIVVSALYRNSSGLVSDHYNDYRVSQSNLCLRLGFRF